MEVYKSETREVIKRFLSRRLSFNDCMAALDAALADLTSRATSEQIASLRALIMENNNIVMKEMERRGPPFDAKILAALGDGITASDYRSGQVIYSQGEIGTPSITFRRAESGLPSFRNSANERSSAFWAQAAFSAKDA